MHPEIWGTIKSVYLAGAVIAVIITLPISKDPSWIIRIFCSLLIGLTWPMSLPIVLLMWIIVRNG